MRDREYLQSLIDGAGDVTIPAVNPSTGTKLYILDEPLVLRSHNHVVLNGCTLRLADFVYSNIFVTEGAWSGESGGAAPPKLCDISVVGTDGATLDGGVPNDLCERTAERDGRPSVLHNTLLLFRNVAGFRVSGLRVVNPRYWGMTFYYASDGVIGDIDFTAANDVPNQDGIDLRVGCHDIRIENITGSTGDDSVALTALGGRHDGIFAVPGESRDIRHVAIRRIHTEVTGGHGIVRLLNHDGILLHDVTVKDVYDRLVDTRRTVCQAAIRLGDERYWTTRPALPGEMHDIRVDGVTTNAPVAVKIACEIPGCVIENVVCVP